MTSEVETKTRCIILLSFHQLGDKSVKLTHISIDYIEASMNKLAKQLANCSLHGESQNEICHIFARILDNAIKPAQSKRSKARYFVFRISLTLEVKLNK